MATDSIREHQTNTIKKKIKSLEKVKEKHINNTVKVREIDLHLTLLNTCAKLI